MGIGKENEVTVGEDKMKEDRRIGRLEGRKKKRAEKDKG